MDTEALLGSRPRCSRNQIHTWPAWVHQLWWPTCPKLASLESKSTRRTDTGYGPGCIEDNSTGGHTQDTVPLRISLCTHTMYPGIRALDAHTTYTKEPSSHKDNRYDEHKRSFGGYETARADPVEFQLTSVAQYCTSREGRNQCV